MARTLALPPCVPWIQPACPEGPALHSPAPWHCHQPAPQKHKSLPLPPSTHGAVMVRTSSRIFLQNFGVPFSTLVEAAGGTQMWCPEQVPVSPGKELHRGEPSKGPMHRLPTHGQGCSRDSSSPTPILGLVPWCHRVETVPPALELQPGWGDTGSPGWGRRRWHCLLQPRNP